jgi:hypothetical protein
MSRNGTSDFSVEYDGVGNLEVNLEGNAYTYAWTPVAGAWYFLTVKRTSGSMEAFADGEEIGAGQSATDDVQGTDALNIGRNSGDSNYFDGIMADAVIYKGDAVSDAEIIKLASAFPLQRSGWVSYYKLDEESGTRADSIGSNTLTDNNTVGYGTGVVNNASDAERADSEYFSITDGAQVGLDILHDLTLLCWVKMESAPATSHAITKWDGSTSNKAYGLDFTTGRLPRFQLSHNGSTTTTLNFSGSFPLATWTHVAATLDGSTRKTWKNAEGYSTNTWTLGDLHDSDSFYSVGSLGTLSNVFDGMIDEVLTAARYLHPEEIKSIYNKNLNGEEMISDPTPEEAPTRNRLIIIA